MGELELSLKLKADGSGLVGTVRASKKEIDKLNKGTDNLDKSSRRAAVGQDKFNKSGRLANGVAKDLNKTLKNTTLRYLSIGAASAGLALGLKSITSIGAGFQQQMANVGSVSGASADELDRLKEAARDQAKVSIFSAREAAQAQYFLASAGLDVNQIISAQKGIMSLAAATQSDLGQTSEITTATLAQFNLESSDSIRVANVFAASISGSQATLQKLGDAMRYVGPVANSLNIDLEDTTAAISLLFNAGFKGEQVGTALRATLIALSKPSSEAAARIKDIGLEITNTSGEFVGFESLIKQLSDSQLDLNTAATLFGSEAAPAMLSLVRSGADDYVKFRDSITNTNKALEMELAQVDTLTGDWKLFKSATEEAALVLFDDMEPALRSTTQTMTNYVGVIVSGIVTLVKIAAVAGTAYLAFKYLPILLASASKAWIVLNLQSAIFSAAAKSGVPIITLLNTSLFGTSVAATAASGALGIMKIAGGILFAAFAGWQIGTLLRENFVEARVAGLFFVSIMINGWERLAFAGKAMWAGIKATGTGAFNVLRDMMSDFLNFVADGLDLVNADEMAAKMRTMANGIKPTESAFNQLQKRLAKLKKEMNGNIDANNKITQSLVTQEIYADKLNQANKKLTESQTESGQVIAELTKEQQNLLDTLDPSTKAANDYFDSVEQLEQIMADFPEQTNRVNIALQNLHLEYENGSGSAKKLKNEIEPIAQIYKDTASSIRGAFRGAFRDVLDGTSSLAERMKNVFKDMLADLLTMAIAKPIMIPMVTGLGGALGFSKTANAQVLGQLGSTPEEAAAFKADNPMLAKSGEILGAGFMGYMAGGIAADMFDVANPGMAQNLSGIGAMIGTAMGGPVIGALVGFAAGSLFSGSYQTKDAGLELSIANGNLSSRSFKDQTKKGGLFGSDKSRTVFGLLDKELESQLQATFGSINDNFNDMAETLGRDANAVLSNFTTSAKVSLQGLSDTEISAAIDGWVQDVTSEMALEILPGLITFQQAGESAGETLSRLTNTLNGINDLDQSIAEQIFVMTGGALNDFAFSVGSDISSINALSISGFSSQLSAELASYYVSLTNTNAAISSTISKIASTQDLTDRVALENTLRDQITSRYQLEQKMLGDMKNTIQSVMADIVSVRGNIKSFISNTLDVANYRDVGSIRGDINSIIPAGAPGYTPFDSREINQRIIASQKIASEAQNNLSFFEGKLADLMGRDDVRNILSKSNLSIEALIDNFLTLERNNGIVNDITKSLQQIGVYETQIDYRKAAAEKAAASVDFLNFSKIDLEQADANAFIEFNNALNDFADLTSDQITQLKSLSDETIRYYNAQKKLDQTMRGAADSLGSTLENLRLATLTPIGRLDDRLGSFQALNTQAAGQSGYDLVNTSAQLNTLVSPLLSEARNLFASGQGYQDIYNEVVGSLADLQNRLIDEAPADYQQESIGLLSNIDSLLDTLQGDLTAAEQAVVNAIDLNRTETVAALVQIQSLLGAEGAAIDGSHAGGIARIPFDGYRALLHEDEAVIDAGTMTGLRKYGIPVSNKSGGENLSRLLPVLERIANASERSGGDINLKVVTTDGKIIKEETIRDLFKRSKRGETVVHTNGVATA